jgi:hypothetical protein
MSQPQDLLVSDDDDTSHVSTPILSHSPASPALSTSLMPSDSTSSDSTKPTSALPANAPLRLPIPTPSANLSQTSFTFINVSEDDSGVDFDDLPPEVASADISIAREFLCSTSLSRCLVCPLWARIHCPLVARRTSLFGCLRVLKSKYVGVLHRCWDYSCSPGACRAQLHFLWRPEIPFSGAHFHFKLISVALGHVGA